MYVESLDGSIATNITASYYIYSATTDHATSELPRPDKLIAEGDYYPIDIGKRRWWYPTTNWNSEQQHHNNTSQRKQHASGTNSTDL